RSEAGRDASAEAVGDAAAGPDPQRRGQEEKRATPPPREDQPKAEEPEQEPRIVVRDKRRIDPTTGAVREPVDRPTPAAPEPQTDAAEGEAGADETDAVESLRRQLVERTEDVKRVQAEYANYRKRVDRDRMAVREQALANVLAEFLPVLDDIGRARDHGELEGGFRQVGESLERITTKLGLVRFGEKGEPFDPNVHEALMHSYSDEVTETTCAEVLRPGYSITGRVLRAARVAVAEPSSDAVSSDTDADSSKGVSGDPEDDAGSGDPPAEESGQGAESNND
ncbi:MAG: nucleotide exchange factor GrpE, partial [Streptosporangiaceae bacterium]